MKCLKRSLQNAAMVMVMTIGFGLAFSSAGAQDIYHGGAPDARRHGYEHGYRDGYQYGLDTRARNVGMDYRTDAYRDGDRGYYPEFGPRDQYRSGYQEGYRDGASDGYAGVRTRLETVYAFPDRDFDPDRARDDRYANTYRDRKWNYQDVAQDIGYRDGLNAGLKDFKDHHSYRPQEHDAWKDGDHGYTDSFGRKGDYERAYRAAYEEGYRQGFGAH